MFVVIQNGTTYAVSDESRKPDLLDGLDGYGKKLFFAIFRDEEGALRQTRIYAPIATTPDKEVEYTVSDTSYELNKAYYMDLFDEIAIARAYVVKMGKGHVCTNSVEVSECDQWCGVEKWADYHTPDQEAETRTMFAFVANFATTGEKDTSAKSLQVDDSVVWGILAKKCHNGLCVGKVLNVHQGGIVQMMWTTRCETHKADGSIIRVSSVHLEISEEWDDSDYGHMNERHGDW